MPTTNPSPTVQRVDIDLGDRSYRIDIGAALLDDPDSFAGLPAASHALIVSNTTVAPLYLERLLKRLSGTYSRVHAVALPDGEAYKTWESLNLIFDALLAHGCDRKTVLFALGGGVVGDMTGFAAASYMRGVPFVQVPTTLLAQVDSSVGGKTGINHPLGKNMIGAFYQPQRVVCDLDTLKTLPPRELSAGLAEVIKYGPIADMVFLDWIEAHMEELMARDPQALAHAVRRSCEIKAHVVGRDEREAGLRAILNFGHTFGHAIEAGMGYGVWLHGEAVGCGMVMAARLSQRLGLIDQVFVDRLQRLIERAGLPVVAPVLGACRTWSAESENRPQRGQFLPGSQAHSSAMGQENGEKWTAAVDLQPTISKSDRLLDARDNAGRYLALMRVDKKSEAGEIKFVLIDGPGRAVLRGAPDALVAEVIAASCGA